MNETIISWTDVTWNPTHGCSKVSDGCSHCYAETISLRYGFTSKPWTNPNASENVRLMPHKLREPYKLKEPSRVFVNSMSDLFHEQIPDDYIRKVFDVMADLPQHVFQILTKRPERAAEWDYKWSFNMWLGTSVEDARVAHRIDTLRNSKALIRFISFEPLINTMGELDLSGIHWAIVGGESGTGYRMMQHHWAREIKNACLKQGTAFFFKQSSAYRTELGTALSEENGTFWRWEQMPLDHKPPVQILDPKEMNAPASWQKAYKPKSFVVRTNPLVPKALALSA